MASFKQDHTKTREWDLHALMIRQLEQIPYIKDLVKRLRRNRYLRNVCGYRDKAPTEAHFTQMKKRIEARDLMIDVSVVNNKAYLEK